MADGAGALLVRSGLIGKQQLTRALEARAERGGTVGEHLVLNDWADDERLTNFYHSRLMVPRLNPNLLARIAHRIIGKLPGDMAIEFRIIPVQLDRQQNLTLAMSDPSDTHAIDEVGFFTGCYVMRAVATQRQIAWCLAHYYGYITPLGETLLEPSEEDEPAADAVPTPRHGPGPITQQVQASRHKVVPPPADDDDAAAAADDDDDDDDEPEVVIIESDAPPRPASRNDSGPTGPIVRRRPNQAPNPPELGARAGEVEINDAQTPRSTSDELPAVVITTDLESDPIATIEETDDDDDLGDEEVYILDQPRHPDEDADEDAVVVLDKPKRRRRTGRQTDVGIGLEPAQPRPISQSDAVPNAVPAPLEEQITEANPTGKFQRISYQQAYGDDDFGPPGTTIPPAYLGALPDTENSGPHNAIPLNVPEDESGAISVPVVQPGAADPVAALADGMSEVADSQRELEVSSIRLVETLRALDAATTRDAIVEALVDHMAKSFGRAIFLVVKGGSLAAFRSKGEVKLAANWKNAKIALSTPSTLRDVVQTRLPFRGRLPDDASQEFIRKLFGKVPDELFLMPCSVRERPIGILGGTDRTERIFHEHIAVVSRGAGDAFERILKARKSG